MPSCERINAITGFSHSGANSLEFVSGILQTVRANSMIASDRFTDQETAGELLAGYDGLLVPGGFGVRGVEGMLEAIRWAREHKLPFFGICLGLQTAIIEFARTVCKIPDTNSSEFAPECENPVIALMRSQEGIQEMGGTMRLGAYPCRLRPGSRGAPAYKATEVSERHRHRYEVSNAYRDVLAEFGLRASGLSPDGSLVEMIELPEHPWFIGCQFHPELKSRPMRPHPLFAGFIGAAVDYSKLHPRAEATRELAELTDCHGNAVRLGEQPVSHRGPVRRRIRRPQRPGRR